MYTTRASQFAKTITMACSSGIQKQPAATMSLSAGPTTPKPKASSIPRGSLPSDVMVQQPPLEFQWPPPIPVSTHTNNVRLQMMNHDPKDLHTARAMIEELRLKVRFQAEHIMKWRKAYAIQIQQHYRYQKEKTDQMNALTSQLLLLESRLKRKQKQIGNLLNHRELTIQRQQKIIDTLSARLADHGLEATETSFTNEMDSLNDSDSAVVLEDLDTDSYMSVMGVGRRKNNGGYNSNRDGSMVNDNITIVRSISDAIETNLNKYCVVRRNNCYLRRPEILETVYSVEEDTEPSSNDVTEKRDKFRQRSEKAISSSSTEGQIDSNEVSCSTNVTATPTATVTIIKPPQQDCAKDFHDMTTNTQTTPIKDDYTAFNMYVPQWQQQQRNSRSMEEQVRRSLSKEDDAEKEDDDDVQLPPKSPQQQMTNYNRVMLNHRSVTKPKDVKYKRINKAKSKSLEELRGRLKNLVENNENHSNNLPTTVLFHANAMLTQTAQSYA